LFYRSGVPPRGKNSALVFQAIEDFFCTFFSLPIKNMYIDGRYAK